MPGVLAEGAPHPDAPPELGGAPSSAPGAPLIIGRYAIYDAIAAGGMATVHLGRLIGAAGFLRTVAIKRLHAQFANDAELTAMLLDEARLAARIQHPNVVPTLDVVANDHEMLLVMEYVRGESLSRLVRRARDAHERIPPTVVASILTGALHGLHAAHEAMDEKGQPLGLVHRDMSPQNILVGSDGISRVLDFGIAKAEGQVHSTKEGDIKGKVLYMSPEQLAAEPLTRTADIYAAGVVLFESLTCVRMFAGENERAALTKIINNEVRLPSEIDADLVTFDAIVRKATAAVPTERYATALDMATDLESRLRAASSAQVSEWVKRLAGDVLDERARMVAEIERSSTRSKPPTASTSSARLKLAVPPSAPAPTIPVPAALRAVEPPVALAPRRRPLGVGTVVLATLLVGCFGIIIFLLVRRPANAAAPEPAATTVAPPQPPEEPAKLAPLMRPTAEPTASATTAPPAAAPTATAATSASKTTPTATVRPPSRARRCDPPYVIDANGHKHFIPECVR